MIGPFHLVDSKFCVVGRSFHPGCVAKLVQDAVQKTAVVNVSDVVAPRDSEEYRIGAVQDLIDTRGHLVSREIVASLVCVLEPTRKRFEHDLTCEMVERLRTEIV